MIDTMEAGIHQKLKFLYLADIFEKETDWAAEVGSISESNPDLAMIRAMSCRLS